MTEAGDSSAQRPPARAFTARALIIGALLVVGLGVLTPWNDWFNDGIPLFYHAMPVVVTLLLLVFGLIVNPLLGDRRLRMGEMMVITVMLLSVGGVVSSGLMRDWPATVTFPSRFMASDTMTVLQVPLTKEDHDRLIASIRKRIESSIAICDGDRDAALSVTEWPGEAERFRAVDTDGDGKLTVDELVANDPEAKTAQSKPWRWAFPTELFLGMPRVGPVDLNDPDYKIEVDGYLDGLQTSRIEPRVGHRALVRWRDDKGVVHDDVALSGKRADVIGRPGVLDLDYGLGKQLQGKKTGSIVATDRGEIELVDVEHPAVPWGTWASVLWHWTPLLFGAFLALVGMVFMVRKQWIDNERLPFPIAMVTGQLIADPEPGSRFAATFRTRAFWVGLTISLLIITWRGLFAYGIVPVNISLDFDLTAAFSGRPWDQAQSKGALYHPRFFFSLAALTFFLPLQLSFSMWFFYIASNFILMYLRVSGVPVSYNSPYNANVGGYFVMVPLIIWLGRKHYWALIKAAFVGHKDPELKSTVPYVWALLVGVGLMLAFLMHFGATFGASLAAIALFLGILLVFARTIAEAGIPYVMLANEYSGVLYNLIGYNLPVIAYMPLGVIGMALIGNSGRENAALYSTNSVSLSTAAGGPPRRTGAIMLGTFVAGAVIAAAAMIHFAYRSDGHSDSHGAEMAQFTIQQVDWNLPDPSSTNTQVAVRDHDALWSYLAGAIITAALGIGRLLFSWWPLHPLIYINSETTPTHVGWFSFLIGWLAKLLVMRYGGSGLYVRLKPVAIGLIAGEAVAGGAFTLCRMISQALGGNLPSFSPLP